MATRTITQLVSDLSGDDIAEGNGETVDFSYRGVEYSIDLTGKEAAGFDKSIAMYIEHATRVGGRRRSSGSSSRSNKSDLDAIRTWARENGHKVSDRGRISQAVKDAYEAAH